MTLDELKRVVKQLRANAVPLNVVESQEQAGAMTEEDIIGHRWRIGEAFYLTEIVPQ